MATIGINDFGGIGRLVFTAMVEQGLLEKGYKVVACLSSPASQPWLPWLHG
jgi:glyceraldehyde-3-phosphate dehydrogenase/erythrose-4-phosphate dehydrogenase